MHDEIVCDIGRGPAAVDGTLAINQVLHEAPVGEDNSGSGAEFQSEDPTILLGPFGEPEDQEKKRTITSYLVILGDWLEWAGPGRWWAGSPN